MSMSTYVVGYRPPDERWQQMKAVWDACQAANLPIPREVAEFFNHDSPDDNGVEVPLTTHQWSDNDRGREGFDVRVADLPPEVTVIRLFNAY